MKDSVFHDQYTVNPDAFKNVTNGIAYRRWLLASNQGLTNPVSYTHLSAPSRGEGVWGFGKDAEIERPKALQDAKPTKRSYRDREFALFL